MKALTVMQPWASLMVLKSPSGRPHKMFETRSWPTKYRGPIAIHASKGFSKDCRELCCKKPFILALEPNEKWREAMLPMIKSRITELLPFGMVLGVGRLVDCLPVEKALKHPKMTDTERRFGDYSPGRFAWLIQDIQPLSNPIPAKGKLGLWNWTPPENLNLKAA